MLFSTSIGCAKRSLGISWSIKNSLAFERVVSEVSEVTVDFADYYIPFTKMLAINAVWIYILNTRGVTSKLSPKKVAKLYALC